MSTYTTTLQLTKNILLKSAELNEWLYDLFDWNRMDQLIELSQASLSSAVEAFKEMRALCDNTLDQYPSESLSFYFNDEDLSIGSIKLVVLRKALSKIFSSIGMLVFFKNSFPVRNH